MKLFGCLLLIGALGLANLSGQSVSQAQPQPQPSNQKEVAVL